MVHAFDASTLEAEVGRYLRVPGQPNLQSELKVICIEKSSLEKLKGAGEKNFNRKPPFYRVFLF